MSISDGNLENWSFTIDEVSAGVYRVYGSDPSGRSVEADGTDPDALLEQCRVAAAEMVVARKNC